MICQHFWVIEQKAELATIELTTECIIECFIYYAHPKSICKNIHFITCNQSSIIKFWFFLFPPPLLPLHLLTANGWCSDLNLKLICRLFSSFVNIICKNELSVQFLSLSYLNLTIHPEHNLTSASAKDLTVSLDKLHQELKSAITPQLWYQGLADLQCMPAPDLKVGQQAFVKAKFFKTTQPSIKLAEKFLWPFNITAQAGSNSITLWLTDTICRAHSVFYFSMLEPAIHNKFSK